MKISDKPTRPAGPPSTPQVSVRLRGGMPARVWTALAGLIVVLLVAVVGLDQWQARRGEASLFGLPWSSSPTRSVAPGPQPRRATGATASTATPQPAPPVPTGSPRVG